MRKVRHLLIAAAALLLGAQTVGATDWSGTNRGAKKSEVKSSTKLYLYNQATGKFLTSGGHWGTEVEVSDLGTALYYTSNKFITVDNYTNSNKVYMGKVSNKPNEDDNGVYIDGGGTQIAEFDSYTLDIVKGTDATYTLYNSTNGYLSVKGGKGSDKNTVVYVNAKDGDNTSWKLIPQDSLIAEFKVAQANYDSPAEASFYISQPDFMRESQVYRKDNEDIWKASAWRSSLTAGNAIDSKLKYGNSLYYHGGGESYEHTVTTYTYTCDSHYYYYYYYYKTCNNTSTTSTTDHGESWKTTCPSCGATVTFTKSSSKPSVETTTTEAGWYIEGSDIYYPKGGTKLNNVDGQPYKVTGAEIETGLSNETVETAATHNTYYNALYGKYFCGRILGNGYITQTITVDRPGEYRLRCQGFTTESGKATLYANDGSALIRKGTYTTQTQAGIDMYNDLYGNELLFKIEDTNADSYTITIKLQISDASEDAVTCFDKFRLYFLGEEKKTDNLLVLDDQQTESTEYFTDTKGLGADKTDVLTLYLRHSGLKATGKWTSIILPVSLSQNQLQAVFGNDVKVAKLESLDNTINGSTDSNNKIWFKSVTNGIEANVPYIIKPSELKTTENPEVDGYVGNPTDESENKDSYMWNLASGDHAGVYFVIPLVKLDKTSITPTTVTTDERAGVKVSMTGDYTKREVEVNGDNVLFGFGGGNLYYYQKKKISFKPFRCWLLESAVTNEAKQLSFSIDGIEDIDAQGVTTMIDDILSDATDGNRFTSNTVYNINGQKVRTAVTSLEGLPKGLYIVNGKKYVVK